MVCSLLEARFQTARDADGAKRVTAGFSDRTKKKQQALLPAPPALLEFAEEGWPRFFILFFILFNSAAPFPYQTFRTSDPLSHYSAANRKPEIGF